jgi:hypothetical protein
MGQDSARIPKSSATLIKLTMQVLVFHTIAAVFHERILTDRTFRFPWFFTALEFVFNLCVSFGARWLRDGIRLTPNGVLVRWGGLCGVLVMASHGMTNSAYVRLNYTTETVLKSSKVFIVMLVAWALLGARPPLRDLFCGVLLCVGLSIFSLADKLFAPKFHPVGVALTVGSLLVGAVLNSLQQYTLHNKSVDSNALLLVQSASGTVCCALFALANGELVDGIATLMDSPSEYWLLLLAHFSFLHLGVRKILTLMAVFDATSAQVVTSMRKVITFALSFVFFPHGKSFTMLHAFGICLSLGAAFILEHGRTRKASL